MASGYSRRDMEDSRIVCNPKILLGKPTISGTRVSVELILESIAAGETIESLLVDFPFLSREDIVAALTYAAEHVSAAPARALA